jgi:hypothetical protein
MVPYSIGEHGSSQSSFSHSALAVEQGAYIYLKIMLSALGVEWGVGVALNYPVWPIKMISFNPEIFCPKSSPKAIQMAKFRPNWSPLLQAGKSYNNGQKAFLLLAFAVLSISLSLAKKSF